MLYRLVFQLSVRVCRLVGSSKEEWLEIKWHTSALVYADDVNIFGGSVSTIHVKDNTESFVVASNET